MFSIFGKNKSGDEKPSGSLLDRLKESVSKTRSQIAARVEGLFTFGKKIDPAVLKQLENALLAADIGVRTTREVLEAVREKVDRQTLSDSGELKAELKRQLLARMSLAAASSNGDSVGGATVATNSQIEPRPRVIFMVGVNGVGKTTTMGKLANRLNLEGHTVLLCAADTFRAAAIEQPSSPHPTIPIAPP